MKQLIKKPNIFAVITASFLLLAVLLAALAIASGPSSKLAIEKIINDLEASLAAQQGQIDETASREIDEFEAQSCQSARSDIADLVELNERWGYWAGNISGYFFFRGASADDLARVDEILEAQVQADNFSAAIDRKLADCFEPKSAES